jgi:tRNA A-37 threonylcarbamoyl transferase component Bud32
MRAIDGFEAIHEPPHVYYVRDGWKASLLGPLRESFASVAHAERTVHADGRTPHFAYAPDGAPGRVLVRRAVRASAASILGDKYVSAERFFHELQSNSDAQRKGLSVPEIVAARLTRVGLFWRYMFVVREVADASNLLSIARGAPPVVKRKLARELGAAVRRMHDAGVYHGDLQLKNILVSGAENGSHIHFIDFDRARFESRRDESLDEANLSRLNRSVEKFLAQAGGVTRTDKMRFLLAYAGDRESAHRLARRVGRTLWLHRIWWWVTGHKP